MMRWLTTSRPNHHPDGLHREQVPGILALAGWAAILVTVVGGFLADRISVERRVDAISAAQVRDQAALVNQIKVAVSDALDSKDYVQRKEWERSELELRGGIDARLSQLEAHSRHALSVLERLPGAKP